MLAAVAGQEERRIGRLTDGHRRVSRGGTVQRYPLHRRLFVGSGYSDVDNRPGLGPPCEKRNTLGITFSAAQLNTNDTRRRVPSASNVGV